jgi:hypothetical protein
MCHIIQTILRYMITLKWHQLSKAVLQFVLLIVSKINFVCLTWNLLHKARVRLNDRGGQQDDYRGQVIIQKRVVHLI